MGYGRPLPSTFEFIERAALAHPQKLAVVEGRQGWTYEAVFAQLVRLSRAFDELEGGGQGATVTHAQITSLR